MIKDTQQNNSQAVITPENVTKIGIMMLELIEKYALPNFQNLSDSQVFSKNGGDIVTEVDLSIEKDFSNYLTKLLPFSFVLGEEAFEADHTIMEQSQLHDYVWIMDPLDGTRNFANGVKCFSSILSLIHKGTPLASWLYDCNKHDVIITYQSEVYYLQTKQKIADAQPHTRTDIKDMIGHFPKKMQNYLAEKNIKSPLNEEDSIYTDLNIIERTSEMQHVKSLSCAGFDFISLALGTRHFAVYNTLKPWDYVGGKLLLETVGGAFEQLRIKNTNPLEESGLFVAVYNKNELARLKNILCLETKPV